MRMSWRSESKRGRGSTQSAVIVAPWSKRSKAAVCHEMIWRSVLTCSDSSPLSPRMSRTILHLFALMNNFVNEGRIHQRDAMTGVEHQCRPPALKAWEWKLVRSHLLNSPLCSGTTFIARCLHGAERCMQNILNGRGFEYRIRTCSVHASVITLLSTPTTYPHRLPTQKL